MPLVCVAFIHQSPSAHLVKWVTESNRPVNIVDDRELRELLSAGRPQLEIPSRDTLSRKIHLAFEKASERIGKLLRVSFFLLPIDPTTLIAEQSWSFALCNGCLDFSEPSCIYCLDGSS